MSYCALLHTGMQQYFPFPPILSCFGCSRRVFLQYIVDSIGLCDDPSDFPLFAKLAVLFYCPGPHFHAGKKLRHKSRGRSIPWKTCEGSPISDFSLLFFHLFIYLFIYVFIYLIIYLSNYLFIYLFICLFIYSSI